MNQMPQNPLAGLKDIHLPPEPSWWPPACGWWLLTALLLTIIVFGLIKWFRHKAHVRPIKLALKELREINLQVDDPKQRRLILQQISGLIRRFSLIFFPQDDVAEFCGQTWLDFICIHSYSMTEAEARKAFVPLIQDPYAPTCNTDLVALRKNLEQWFNGLKRKKPPKNSVKREFKPANGDNP